MVEKKSSNSTHELYFDHLETSEATDRYSLFASVFDIEDRKTGLTPAEQHCT
jgi:hypothetical protein